MKMAELLQQAVALKLLRPLDARFATMLVEENAPAAQLAAALLSRDTGEGHVCLPLDRLTPEMAFPARHAGLAQALFDYAAPSGGWHDALLASQAVSDDGAAATPLKLADNCLYLNRMFYNERRVAAFFLQENRRIAQDATRLHVVLDALFGSGESEVNWQKVAAAVALTRRISVISGGPGTGKTTTVAKLLTALIQLETPERLRIRLAAPTGKAAARLTESLGKALSHLSLSPQQKMLLPEEATTLHRLLGVQPGSQQVRYHADNPLHLDVLVVDEASMVDLLMMARLVAALPAHARVIFLGDRDQLASVEAGAVLGDICHFLRFGFSPERAAELSDLTGNPVSAGECEQMPMLCDALCLLQKSYRFDGTSGIGQLAVAVNRGDVPMAMTALNGDYADIVYHPLRSRDDYAAALADTLKGYARYLAALKSPGATPDERLEAFNEFQLLCALRAGPFGVAGLNRRVEQLLVRHGHIAPGELAGRWYHGRPVMISRNESALGLFNGDVGIVLRDESGLRVWFQMPDGTLKSVPPGRMPEHETAWAMTVHKSQGSEFESVALVLPDRFAAPLTRELVYNAITRARAFLALYADASVLKQAINTRTERRSGLLNTFASAEISSD